ncbi:hypothetical protein AFLA_011917 [Aspergillus flavus NRRL3357]|nr:hypothetical protein AFLA_011917 [Aspergillus flavus NRRL3357]
MQERVSAEGRGEGRIWKEKFDVKLEKDWPQRRGESANVVLVLSPWWRWVGMNEALFGCGVRASREPWLQSTLAQWLVDPCCTRWLRSTSALEAPLKILILWPWKVLRSIR